MVTHDIDEAVRGRPGAVPRPAAGSPSSAPRPVLGYPADEFVETGSALPKGLRRLTVTRPTAGT
jgi:hypothetical protein